MTRFFWFRQNNSGGGSNIRSERGIGDQVIFEADSEEEAIRVALDSGIMYSGTRSGDCPEIGCCGTRWPSHAWEESITLEDVRETAKIMESCGGAEKFGFIHFRNGEIQMVRV